MTPGRWTVRTDRFGGVILRAPGGAECYGQPGDDAAATLESLGYSADFEPATDEVITGPATSTAAEYFGGEGA